jgi:hypothetical protein
VPAPVRADCKVTFDDGGVIDCFTSFTARDAFTDPLGSVEATVAPATSSQWRDYATKLAKGNQVHLYINNAHQGRFLIEDSDTEVSPEGGRVMKVRCHTPLITPYQGAAPADLSLSSLTDTSVENAFLTILAPYGFSKVVTDARSHVNALTGVPLPGGAPPPFAVGDGNRLKAIDSTGRVGYIVPTIKISNTKALSANNTSAAVNIFQVTGAIRVTKLYGIVSTTIGVNHTGSQFAGYDGTTTTPLSAAATTPLSAAAADSYLGVNALAATPTSVAVNTAAVWHESASANTLVFQEFFGGAKSGVSTYLQYLYATTDTPTSGGITFYCEYEPLSADAIVTAV